LTLINFHQEFISHIPFIGASLAKSIWSISPDSSILNNQLNGELFFIGGLASSLALSLKLLFIEIINTPLTLTMDNSSPGDSSNTGAAPAPGSASGSGVPSGSATGSGVSSGSGVAPGSEVASGSGTASGSGVASGSGTASGSTKRIITD